MPDATADPVPPIYADYEILKASSPADLARGVNARLAAGYVPIGGVVTAPVSPPTGVRYLQAVARPVFSRAVLPGYQVVTRVSAARAADPADSR